MIFCDVPNWTDILETNVQVNCDVYSESTNYSVDSPESTLLVQTPSPQLQSTLSVQTSSPEIPVQTFCPVIPVHTSSL